MWGLYVFLLLVREVSAFLYGNSPLSDVTFDFWQAEVRQPTQSAINYMHSSKQNSKEWVVKPQNRQN